MRLDDTIALAFQLVLWKYMKNFLVFYKEMKTERENVSTKAAIKMLRSMSRNELFYLSYVDVD